MNGGDYKLRLKDFFNYYELTRSQSELVDELEEFLHSDDFCFIIKGAAGTGKTFIVRGLTDYLSAVKGKFSLAAPTGRAAKILEEKTGKTASTIHRMIYTSKEIVEYKEKITLRKNYYKLQICFLDDTNDKQQVETTEVPKFFFKLKKNEDSDNAIYIIDEASMISDSYNEDLFLRFGSGKLLSDLIEYIRDSLNELNKRKLILIGDDCQLPPIDMNFSPALDSSYLKTNFNLTVREFTLKEIVRQKLDSGILKNANQIRTWYTQNNFNKIYLEPNCRDIVDVTKVKLIEEYFKKYKESSDKDLIMIAYSNKTVQDYNLMIRERLWGDNRDLQVGDRLIVVKNNYKYSLLNGEFIIVTETGPREIRRVSLKRKNKNGVIHETKVDLFFRRAAVKTDFSTDEFLVLIIENALYSNEVTLTREEYQALYVLFKINNKHLKPGTLEFKERLLNDDYFNALQVKFGYAITCHKAQGGEWKYVFLNCRSPIGYFNKKYFHWLYTAITRAKEILYYANAPHISVSFPIKPNSKLASSYNEMVFVLDSEIREWEIHHYFPSDRNFLKKMYLGIVSLIRDDGIEVRSIKHLKFQESYTIARGDELVELIFTYNKEEKITNFYVNANKEKSWIVRMMDKLNILKGKEIVVEGELNQKT